jgi:hypothetical protein
MPAVFRATQQETFAQAIALGQHAVEAAEAAASGEGVPTGADWDPTLQATPSRHARRLFQGRRDLVLLVIDPELVTADFRCEDGGNGNFYPHVYGPLNVSAVTAVVAFEPNADGSFELPADLDQ